MRRRRFEYLFSAMISIPSRWELALHRSQVTHPDTALGERHKLPVKRAAFQFGMCCGEVADGEVAIAQPLAYTAN